MSGDQHSIFIGYRRDDTADAAGRVYDRLRNEFGAEAVFKDVDRLPPGVDFGDFILTVLPKCRVFLAMIGPGWLEASDEAGDRRLDDPEDWVRIELETALETPGLQVVPVLINGAPMPRADDLPDCLRVLPRLNAAFVRRDPDFHRDMDKLIGALKDGLQSGRAVEVEQNAAPVLATGSSAAWKLIEGSLDRYDYEEFLAHFPGTPEVMLASRCLRQLEAWGAVNGSEPESIAEFLNSAPFPAVEKVAREALQAAEAREREAFQRALAERREWEERLGPEAARAALTAKAGGPVAERVYTVQLDGVSNWPAPAMVAIPPGRFLMGAPAGEEGSHDRERPKHEVRIDYPFALGKHAVTFAEWDAALASGAWLAHPGDEGWGRERRPLIYVSWEDAQAYLAWLNGRLGLTGRPDAYRLPSEAEWEYACRAGTETPFSFGETITPDQANCIGNVTYGGGPKGTYQEKTMPVGSYSANGFGLYDMHGSVWEWCADTWHDTYNGAPTDGSVWEGGDPSLRVLRGGSWLNSPSRLRSAGRIGSNPTGRIDIFGFRVARTLLPPAP